MATISPAALSRVGAFAAWTDTNAGGDEFVFGGSGVILTFHNGHASPITVAIAPTATVMDTPGGPTAPAARSMVIPAGQVGQILFDAKNVSPYLNANGRIPVTYTGHDALLKVRAAQRD